MYVSSFSLRYSAEKEKERAGLTYPFRTQFQGERQRAGFPLKHLLDTLVSLGLGCEHLGTAAGLLAHGAAVQACSPVTPSCVSTSRFRLKLMNFIES